VGGVEVRAAARFQAEPHHPSAARDPNDVLQERERHSTAQEIRVRAHRFELSVTIAQIFQCADSGDDIPMPHRP
jgi:hypothetical protein